MINFLSQSMKLLDNLNGQQTLHTLHRAVAYHIKIGNGKFIFRLWKCSNLKCSMLKCSDWKCSDCKHQAGKCWDWQNGMAFLGRHKYEWCCNKHYVIKYNWLENHILGNCSRLLKSCIKWGGHQHRLAHQCSLCEHTYTYTSLPLMPTVSVFK